jgi:hypothetical protein
MSMYGSNMLFVENDFGRHSIGSTTDGLKKDADGSLTVVIQKDKPADTSNWLPAPEGPFNLTLRLLWAADADTRRFVPASRREAGELITETSEGPLLAPKRASLPRLLRWPFPTGGAMFSVTVLGRMGWQMSDFFWAMPRTSTRPSAAKA